MCIGDNVDEAIDLLGNDFGVFAGLEPGAVIRQWCLNATEPAPLCSGLVLSIENNAFGAIDNLTASVCLNPGGPTRLALPDDLVLGDMRFRDVVALLGPPHEVDRFAAEDSWYYEYIYYHGPEGTHQLTYTHCGPTGVGELSDEALQSELVTSAEIGYRR